MKANWVECQAALQVLWHQLMIVKRNNQLFSGALQIII